MRRKVVLPSFNGVAAGQTATIDLSTDRTYQAIYLRYKTNAAQATIEADITGIRLKVNGVVQRSFSAAQLNTILALNGLSFTAGYIPILLAEPWRRTPEGEEALGWGMGDVDTFQIEVDIAGGAVAPTLGGFAEVVYESRKLGNIVKWTTDTVVVGAAGTITVTSYPKTEIGYYRVHAFSANTTQVAVKVDGIDVYNLLTADNTAEIKRRSITSQANVFSVCFDDTQQATDYLPMVYRDASGQPRRVSELRFDFSQSGAGNFTTLRETLGPKN